MARSARRVPLLLPQILVLTAVNCSDTGTDDSTTGETSQATGTTEPGTGESGANEAEATSSAETTGGQEDPESSTSDTGSSTNAELDSESSDSTPDDTDTTGSDEASTGSDDGGWSSLSDLPEARQEISVVAFDGDIYVVGGFDSGREPTPHTRVYNIAGDDWRTGPELPVAMHHANVAPVGERLYILGYLDSDWQAQGDIFSLSPGGEWQPLAENLPTDRERGSSGVAVLGEEICLMGGMRGAALTEVDCFDSRDNSWRQLPDLPNRSDHLVATAYDEHLFVFGGRNLMIKDHVSEVYALAPGGSEWQARAEMPTSRGGMAGTQLDGYMYVFGGEGNADDPKGMFSACERYDLAGDSWTTLPEMQVARHGTGAAAIMGRIFVPAGADAEGFAAIASFEVFQP